jgi:hypothetical protein
MSRVDDIRAFAVADLSWDDPLHSFESAKSLYGIACDKAASAAQWYMRGRGARRLAAQLLRLAAALLAAAGLLVPVLALVDTRLPSQLGYALLVGSGSCLLINKALGLSSGWIRYVTTAFEITSQLEQFQLDWAKSLARLAGRAPNPDELATLLDQISHFIEAINRLVENETRSWGAQFQEELGELERVVQGKVQTMRATEERRRMGKETS